MAWFKDANGKPVWREAGGQQVAPNPIKVQGAELGNQRTAQQINIDNTMLPYQVQKAKAEAAKSQADAAKAKIESGLDPQKLANIRAAQAQIDRLQYLFNKGPGRTSGLRGLFDYLPSSDNQQFDTAGAGLGEVGLAAFRVPGVGSQSDAELRAFINANRPQASDFDSRIKEKFNNLQNRLDQNYQVYGIKRPVAKRYKDEPKVIDYNSLPDK